ncbi:TetR/AcrR family transcriptional regulator [Nocardia terpenica]|uniref:TetR family transcriptional regulator n=1 Tax=Nocardia terpenica TaxID=455432 RepID=A0A291RTF6_9NOCA|nr:TetR family transcriptional regulator [Nocardia terpenica]ATL70522.1 TetR family transcriptional regulator [Nocardia terpenica]
MAWDTERTKQLLLDAATTEFSEHGLAGARVDRIASAAGVNKERIYQYFGKKDELFGIVLTREVTRVMDAVPITGTGPQAVVGYAVGLFDYLCATPALARLMFWEGLELGAPVAEPERRANTRAKVAAMRDAVPGLTETEAQEVLSTILTLCHGWHSLPNLDRLLAGGKSGTAARARRRREFIARTVAAALDSLVAE